MINTVKAGTAVSDASLNQRSPQREPAAPPPKKEAPPPAPALTPGVDSDLRLVIERGADNAYYVYRLIDRITGKVVVELPRDQVRDLATTPSYAAGTVVSTKV